MITLFKVLTISVFLFAQAPPPKSGVKKQTEEKYDQDKLPPYEIGCGQLGAKPTPHPCQCVRYREKVKMDAAARCLDLKTHEARMACYRTVPECEEIHVVDVDEANRGEEGMPIQCRRSCRRGKCLCCQS